MNNYTVTLFGSDNIANLCCSLNLLSPWSYSLWISETELWFSSFLAYFPVIGYSYAAIIIVYYRTITFRIQFISQVPAHLSDFHPLDLPLPDHVCQILSGPNYDYYSSTMRFTISSPVVCISGCCLSELIVSSFYTIDTGTVVFRFALHSRAELVTCTVFLFLCSNTIFLMYGNVDFGHPIILLS